MEGHSISSIAKLHFPSRARLLPSACCPDKDLLVLVSRIGKADRMSLWKMQGSKKWEVDVNDEIIALAWSPDGQTIVVAHHPPRISLHSIQDGREERSLSVGIPHSSTANHRISGLWWFKTGRKDAKSSLPDMFGRGHTTTGSAHSILKMLPLLDPLQDDTQPLNANDLFAFQGTKGRSTKTSFGLPDAIASWPALPPDLLAASIQVPPRVGENIRPGEELDELDHSNVDSLLTATDSSGQIHFFIDGSYACGSIQLGLACVVTSLIKDPSAPILYVLYINIERASSTMPSRTNLLPTAVRLPLLDERKTRQIAISCSSARELVWYTMRVVKEMRKAWFGGDGSDGAREINSNWVRAIHERQSQFGQQEANAILDLTSMLITGRASEALVDFFSAGEQMSERGLQKWEATVSEALMKLRSFSEKRVGPAFQRLHLVLEEVQGWSQLPHDFAHFEFSAAEINACLDLASRGIVIAAWLAATARRELLRFREFMSFLRYEVSKGHPSNPHTHQLSPRHDILEVNSYLMSGLVVSSIDKWFIGPVPQFAPQDLIASPATQGLSSIMAQARHVLADPSQVTWPPNTKKRDLSHLDRNLDALIQALADKCGTLFDRASKAVSRLAILDPRWHMPGLAPAPYSGNLGNEPATKHVLARSRTVCNENEPGNLTQHVVVCVPEDRENVMNKELLCIIHATYRQEGDSQALCKVAVAILECGIRSEESHAWLNVPGEELLDEFNVADMDFFDEQHLVIVCGTPPAEGPVIGMIDYLDLGYREVDVRGYINGPSREDIVSEAMKQRKAGLLASVPVPIKKSRVLRLDGQMRPSMALNGRAGRRVACVLDGTGLKYGAGLELEVLDMEGEEDEE